MTTPKQLAAEINKAMGTKAVSMGSDPRFVVKYIPTGVLPIDVLLGGGIPRGRITEFYGAFSSLKSYLALCAIATAQKAGGTAVLVDTEHSWDPVWGKHIGVNTGSLILKQPNTGEEAVDIIQVALAGNADIIVWDSVAATQPKAEADVQLSGGKNIQPARLAALMSVALRRLNTTNHQTALLCINQTRSKVGVVFGSPETTPGGRALPFYASYRVTFNKAGRITKPRKAYDGEKFVTSQETVIQKIRAQLVKSKLSRPDREEWFRWNIETGTVETLPYLVAVGLEHGLIQKGTRTWSMMGKTFSTEARFHGYLESEPRVVEGLTAMAYGDEAKAMSLLRPRRLKASSSRSS